MDTTTIIIIIIFVTISIISMIAMAIYQNKTKNAVTNFIARNKHAAIIHLYGDIILIDDKKIAMFDHIRGNNHQHMIALPNGKHVIEAKYSTTTTSLSGNKNWQSDMISTEILVQSGYEYTIGIFEFSAAKRSNYYGEQSLLESEGLCVSEQTLIDAPSIGKNPFYILCYEKNLK